MSIESASFAVYKPKTKKCLQVQGEWISEYCASDDLFTVCRINFDGDPINYWVRFEEIYDKLEDEDWLVCTDIDGITYKVSGTDFYNTKDSLRFIKIKNPVISCTTPQPGGLMKVEKNTITINGEDPVVHEGSWGYRENGGIGPLRDTTPSERLSNCVVRGFAFKPGTGEGVASVNGGSGGLLSYNGEVFAYTFNGATDEQWLIYNVRNTPSDDNALLTNIYSHEVFWLPREGKFAVHSSNNGLILIELDKNKDGMAQFIATKPSIYSTGNTYATFIDDDVYVLETSSSLSHKTKFIIKKDPTALWADDPELIQQTLTDTLEANPAGDKPYRFARHGDWFYFYQAKRVYKISISDTRSSNLVTPYFVCEVPSTPYAMVNLPYLDRPSMMIAGGTSMTGSTVPTTQFLYLVGLDDRREHGAQYITSPDEHVFTSRIRTSTEMNQGQELAFSDYNANIAATSNGINFEFIKHNINQNNVEVRALGFNDAAGSGTNKSISGLHVGGTSSTFYKGQTQENGGYALIPGAKNESYTIKDTDINKSLGWVETTTEGKGRSVQAASAPSPKINLYGEASDISSHPELISINTAKDSYGDLEVKEFAHKNGTLTQENIDLGRVVSKSRISIWTPQGYSISPIDYKDANSYGWHFGSSDVPWPVRKDWHTSTLEVSVWTLVPTSDASRVVVLFDIYKAGFERDLLRRSCRADMKTDSRNALMFAHEGVKAKRAIRAYQMPYQGRSDAFSNSLHDVKGVYHAFSGGEYQAVVLDVDQDTVVVSDATELPTDSADGTMAIISLVTGDNPRPEVHRRDAGAWTQLNETETDDWIQSQRLDLKPTVIDGFTPHGSYKNVSGLKFDWHDDDWTDDNVPVTGDRIATAVRDVGNTPCLTVDSGNDLNQACTGFIGHGHQLVVNYQVSGKSYTANSDMEFSKDLQNGVRPRQTTDLSENNLASWLNSDGTEINTAPITFSNFDIDSPVEVKSTTGIHEAFGYAGEPEGTWRIVENGVSSLYSTQKHLKKGIGRSDVGEPFCIAEKGTIAIDRFGTSVTSGKLAFLNESALSSNVYIYLSHKSCFSQRMNPAHGFVYNVEGVDVVSEMTYKDFGTVSRSQESKDTRANAYSGAAKCVFTLYKPGETENYILQGTSAARPDFDGLCQLSSNWIQTSVDSWFASSPTTNFYKEVDGELYAGFAYGDKLNVDDGDTFSVGFQLVFERIQTGSGLRIRYDHRTYIEWREFSLSQGKPESIRKKIEVNENQILDTTISQTYGSKFGITACAYDSSSSQVCVYSYTTTSQCRAWSFNVEAKTYSNFPNFADELNPSNCTLDGTSLADKQAVIAAHIFNGQLIGILESNTELDLDYASDYLNKNAWLPTSSMRETKARVLTTAPAASPETMTSVPLPAGWTEFTVFSFAGERVSISNGLQVMEADPADWVWSEVASELTNLLEPDQKIWSYQPGSNRMYGQAGIGEELNSALVHVSTMPQSAQKPLKYINNIEIVTTTVRQAWEEQFISLDSQMLGDDFIIENVSTEITEPEISSIDDLPEISGGRWELVDEDTELVNETGIGELRWEADTQRFAIKPTNTTNTGKRGYNSAETFGVKLPRDRVTVFPLIASNEPHPDNVIYPVATRFNSTVWNYLTLELGKCGFAGAMCEHRTNEYSKQHPASYSRTNFLIGYPALFVDGYWDVESSSSDKFARTQPLVAPEGLAALQHLKAPTWTIYDFAMENPPGSVLYRMSGTTSTSSSKASHLNGDIFIVDGPGTYARYDEAGSYDASVFNDYYPNDFNEKCSLRDVIGGRLLGATTEGFKEAGFTELKDYFYRFVKEEES